MSGASTNPALVVDRNEGALNFTDVTSLLPTTNFSLGPDQAAAVDLDRDGREEHLLTNIDGRIDVLRFDAMTGSFVVDSVSGPRQVVMFPPSLETGDVDGDLTGNALDDVLLAKRLRHMQNDGDLTISDAPGRLAGPTSTADKLALGEFDPDRDLDILAGFVSIPGTGVTYFRNDGLGNLTEDLLFNRGTTTAVFSIGAGNLDSDGDLDAVIGSDFTTPAEVLLSQQGMSLQFASTLPYFGRFASDIEVFDAESDGDPDLFVASYGIFGGSQGQAVADTL